MVLQEKTNQLSEKNSCLGKVLIPEEKIRAEVKKAAAQLDKLYDGRPLLLVGILKGSFIFMADLCRELSVPCEIGFITAKSYYSGTESSGKVTVSGELSQDLSKYHLVLVEDIIDTGRTLKEVVRIMKERSPVSVTVVTLLDKPERRLVEFEPDVSLFTVPDKFVVGYGLDCAEQFRYLPCIAEYIPEK